MIDIRKSIVVLAVLVMPAFMVQAGEIHDAAMEGNLDKVKALLKKDKKLVNAKSEKEGETPLHLAA